MDMQEVKFTLTGDRPLLMHNPQTASPLNLLGQEMKEITGKKKKTLEDHKTLAWLGFKSSLYINEDGPFVPCTWLLAAVAKASFSTAKVSKASIMADVMFPEDEIRLNYDGPRTAEGLWGEGVGISPFVDMRLVKQGQARIDRVRPIFHDWSITTSMLVNIDNLNLSTFKQILNATSYGGLGDYRPLFGTFKVDYL